MITNNPYRCLTSHLGSSRSSTNSTILGVDLALIHNTARVAGAAIKRGLDTVPAPIMLLQPTLLFDILSEHD